MRVQASRLVRGGMIAVLFSEEESWTFSLHIVTYANRPNR
jgi:hypothetical protein